MIGVLIFYSRHRGQIDPDEPVGDLSSESRVLHRLKPVSYTHLDVYKRQVFNAFAGL